VNGCGARQGHALKTPHFRLNQPAAHCARGQASRFEAARLAVHQIQWRCRIRPARVGPSPDGAPSLRPDLAVCGLSPPTPGSRPSRGHG